MQHRLAALRYSMSKPMMLWLTRNMNSYGQAKRREKDIHSLFRFKF